MDPLNHPVEFPTTCWGRITCAGGVADAGGRGWWVEIGDAERIIEKIGAARVAVAQGLWLVWFAPEDSVR